MGWFSSDNDSGYGKSAERNASKDTGEKAGPPERGKTRVGEGRDRGNRDRTPEFKGYGPKFEEAGKRGVWESISDYFTGSEEQAGPWGTAKDFNLSKKEYDETIGRGRYESLGLGARMQREMDYFKEAPLDYVSDLLDNPLVAGGAAMTGLGMTAFGLKVADAAVDIFQEEEDVLGAAKNIAVGALSFTPVGAAVPAPVRAVAKAGLKEGTEGMGKAIGSTIGGKVTAQATETLASAMTDNPYAKVALTATGGAFGAWGGQKAVETALAKPKTPKARPVPRKESDGNRRSPLVASGEQAVASSQQLMQEPDVDLYASTVQQLPFYGLQDPKQLYYGV